MPQQSSWRADTDWERRRTGSGTQPLPQIWRPELRPWRPRVAVQRIRTNSTASWARWLEAALCPPDAVCLD